jgi:hypothetical protein
MIVRRVATWVDLTRCRPILPQVFQLRAQAMLVSYSFTTSWR